MEEHKKDGRKLMPPDGKKKKKKESNSNQVRCLSDPARDLSFFARIQI